MGTSVLQQLTMTRLTWALGTMIGPLIGVFQNPPALDNSDQRTRGCPVVLMALVLVAEPSLLWHRSRHGTTSCQS